MTSNRRFKLIREVKDKAEKNKVNVMTLYCLIATMTDRELVKFHKEMLEQK